MVFHHVPMERSLQLRNLFPQLSTSQLGHGTADQRPVDAFESSRQTAATARESTRIGTAVEEFLRFDSPIQHQTRSAAEDLEIAGTPIKKGDRVIPVLGAANRDSTRFSDPDQVDLSRDPNPHLAFGFGPHFCLGPPLARLEAQIAIPAILERWPTIDLINPQPSFRRHTSQRNPVVWN